jgi:hypothetical protein
MQSTVLSRSAGATTSAGCDKSWVPFTIRIRLWPLGSTKIGATPLEAPFTCFTWLVLMPSLLKFSTVAGPNVLTNSSHHEHVGSAQFSRHGLTRALARNPEVKLLSDNRLSRFGKTIRKRNQVDIVAADDLQRAESLACDLWGPRGCEQEERGG